MRAHGHTYCSIYSPYYASAARFPGSSCLLLCCKFQSCSVRPFTEAIVPNPCTMSTTADHDNVQSGSPAATDHSSDLASISDPLAALERALSTVPTTTAPPASSLPSSTVIQGRPRCGPILSLAYSILPLKRPVLIAPCSLVRLTPFMNMHVVLLFLPLLLPLPPAGPISSMHLYKPVLQ